MSFALFFCVLVISGSFLGSTAMKLVVTQQSSGETKRHNNKQQTTNNISNKKKQQHIHSNQAERLEFSDSFFYR